MFFFFKQKTAYEMRISDWSSDVCSSDLADLDKVVAYANTVRNTLFHGGKHGHDQWDDPVRMRRLLELTITVLGELAALGEFGGDRSEEHTSELQSLMRISYAVFCLKKTTKHIIIQAIP